MASMETRNMRDRGRIPFHVFKHTRFHQREHTHIAHVPLYYLPILFCVYHDLNDLSLLLCSCLYLDDIDDPAAKFWRARLEYWDVVEAGFRDGLGEIN
jgi:hypothetical protein